MDQPHPDKPQMPGSWVPELGLSTREGLSDIADGLLIRVDAGLYLGGTDRAVSSTG